MAWPGDFLNRFRLAGTPGAAARAGVPVDRPAEAAAELEPILALLAEAEPASAAVRERARQDAKDIRERARARPGRVGPPDRPGRTASDRLP